ncbi:MAG: Gfo/Idh/MocA family oxidoreductase, partial [Armatimonadetes bacterium]|nr:Gfo/Idh/MocA family oxidoreductase [Armatimonadota bacterium]
MPPKKSQPIRMAVAGLGRAGWDIHISAIRGRKDFTLTDVVDIEQSRLDEARAEFGCRTHTSFPSFLRHNDAELIVVATQSHDHARQSRQALEAGLHVLCEKPMATSLRQADSVIAQAEKSPGLFTVHQSLRLDPGFLHIQEVIRSGVLGKVFQIRRGSYGYARRNDWQTLRKYGGGALNNTGVHLLDQVCQLLDSPVQDAWGDLKQIVNPGDADDHIKVVVRAESGMVGEVEVTYACALPLPAWIVMGSRGTLVSDGKTSRLRCTKARKLPRMKVNDSHMVATRKYGSGETIEFEEKTMPTKLAPKKDFYDSLYDSIRKG